MKNKSSNKNGRAVVVMTALFDFICFEAALLLGYWLWITYPWHGNYQYFSDYAGILWIVPPLGVFVFHAVGLYKPQMGIMGVAEQSLIFKGIWLLYFAAFAISFFYRGVDFSRLATFYSIFIAIVLISIERHLVRYLYAWLHAKGLFGQKALIYGAGYHGQRLARWIQQSPKLGIKVMGFLDDHTERLVKKPVSPKIVGGFEDLKSLVEEEDIRILFIADRKLEDVNIYAFFEICQDLGVTCWAIPSVFHPHIERVSFKSIGGIPLVGIREQAGFKLYLSTKRVLDFLFASVLAVLLAPVYLLVALGVYLTSGTPVLFRQIRIGQGGKKFTVYKFRTLKPGYADTISPEIGSKKAKNPEISVFAAFLRSSGLDELPQLVNVLRGDMSLIGPRPEMPFIVEKYGPLEKERLRLKPGVTGLWQISRDRKRQLIHENMDYDLYYAENVAFNLDLAILVKTLFTVASRFFSVFRKSEEEEKEETW